MNITTEEMKKRRNHLLELKGKIENNLSVAPVGSLRLITSSTQTQYYYREKSSERVGTYIPKRDFTLAKALAQKDYERRLLCSVERELKAIETYLRGLPKFSAEEVYGSLHLERQKLVLPIRESDEQYVQRWEQIPYQAKVIDDSVPIIMTEKGERVRSKSEMMIADALFGEGIPYKYECPVYLNGFGWVHPDFTTLNVQKRKEVYWEHLGMMDDPVYAEKNLHKILNFEKNGYTLGDNLILSWETRNHPITRKDIKRMIMQHLR